MTSEKIISNNVNSSKNNKHIKVCHILNSLLPSGAETMLANSESNWTGCEKHILATKKELGNYADTLEKAGYQIHHVAQVHFLQQHFFVVLFLKKLRPDVVHIHRESQDCYYALDARLAGVSSIVRTVHNVFDFHGQLRLRRILTRWIGRKLGTRYIAIGRSVFNNEKNNFKNRPFKIIDNWCNESRFIFIEEELKKKKRMELNITEDTFVIISVGNCSPIKNHMLLLRAIDKIVRENRLAKVLYFHVGHGVTEAEETAYVKEHHLENIVRFMGHVDPIEYYQVADLNVMPSLYEGVGISALEAMFCGITCLLTDVVGLCDFKYLESEDIIFSTLDEVDFFTNVEKLWSQFRCGELRNSRELSEIAHIKYNRGKSVQQYMEVYRQ